MRFSGHWDVVDKTGDSRGNPGRMATLLLSQQEAIKQLKQFVAGTITVRCTRTYHGRGQGRRKEGRDVLLLQDCGG